MRFKISYMIFFVEQCRAFLEQVHNMSSVWQGAPVVIGGDFNSTPSVGLLILYDKIILSMEEICDLQIVFANWNIGPSYSFVVTIYGH